MLIETNAAAIKEKRNRSIDTEILQQLDDDFKFPVVFAMEHNEVEMREGTNSTRTKCTARYVL